MSNDWFKQKEEAAGVNRLYATWLVYRALGEIPVRIIVFLVTCCTYFHLNKQKSALNNYLKTLEKFTGQKRFSPSFFNRFKIFLNYANSLADKMIAFSGNPFEMDFVDPKALGEILENLEQKRGIFFITNHIGNAEVMRTLLMKKELPDGVKVNIFAQKNQCKIFNDFLTKIEVKTDIETFAVEDITPETSVKIESKLQNGEIVFMAGDRISAQNPESYYEQNLLEKKLKFPIGVLRFAGILTTNIYFITCGKTATKYVVECEKFLPAKAKRESIAKLQNDYVKFLQESILKYPFQYYQFYDFWDEV